MCFNAELGGCCVSTIGKQGRGDCLRLLIAPVGLESFKEPAFSCSESFATHHTDYT